MSISSLMNMTATVYSWTKTSDAYGGWARTSDARYAGMPCRIQAISGEERMTYASQRVMVTHKLYAPPDYSGIDPEDHVVDADGTRYRVQFVRDPDQMGHHTEVVMEQVQGCIH